MNLPPTRSNDATGRMSMLVGALRTPVSCPLPEHGRVKALLSFDSTSAAAIYLAALPYRLRDFFQWLFSTPGRARVFGAGLLIYGLVLSVLAFTY